MYSNVFVSTHPLVAHKLTLLRRTTTEPKKFRELVRELAGLLAYEATLDLKTRPLEIETPLAKTTGAELEEKSWLDPYLACRVGYGGGHLGIDAFGRSLAHRFVSRRTHTPASSVLQQTAGRRNRSGLSDS